MVLANANFHGWRWLRMHGHCDGKMDMGVVNGHVVVEGFFRISSPLFGWWVYNGILNSIVRRGGDFCLIFGKVLRDVVHPRWRHLVTTFYEKRISRPDFGCGRVNVQETCSFGRRDPLVL